MRMESFWRGGIGTEEAELKRNEKEVKKRARKCRSNHRCTPIRLKLSKDLEKNNPTSPYNTVILIHINTIL